MSREKLRARLLEPLKPPARVAALLEPGEPRLGELAPMSADIPGAPDLAPEPAPSENAGKRRRITGWYTADEVRALRGELVSIEGTIPPGRYLCTWLETPADE